MVRSITDIADEAYNATLCAVRVDIGPAETFGVSGTVGMSGTVGVSCTDALPVCADGGSLPVCAVAALQVSASTNLDTGLETFTTINHGSTSAVAASTAYQLPAVACKSVAVKAGDDNTNEIYIGASTVTATGAATDGYRLNAGQGITFRFDNVDTIYFAAQTAGDWIHYVSIND